MNTCTDEWNRSTRVTQRVSLDVHFEEAEQRCAEALSSSAAQQVAQLSYSTYVGVYLSLRFNAEHLVQCCALCSLLCLAFGGVLRLCVCTFARVCLNDL